MTIKYMVTLISILILNFTENKPEGVKSENYVNYVKNNENILKKIMKNCF
jgi:hypothetical protein